MQNAGDITQDGQEDVDEQIGTAAALEKDAERRNKDGEDDFNDVARKRENWLVCGFAGHHP